MQAFLGAIAVLSVALAAATGCSNESLKQYYARAPPTAPIGQAFRDTADHHYSVPQVIDVDNPAATLIPAYAWGSPDCDLSQFLLTGDGVLGESAQHPTLFRTKAFPASGTLTENVLFSYCVKRLPRGTRYHPY